MINLDLYTVSRRIDELEPEQIMEIISNQLKAA